MSPTSLVLGISTLLPSASLITVYIAVMSSTTPS